MTSDDDVTAARPTQRCWRSGRASPSSSSSRDDQRESPRRERCGWVLALALIACGPAPSGPLEVELGTGEVAFEGLEGGERLPLVAGPQGGHHVWVSFRAQGLESARAFLTIDAIPLTSTEPPPRRSPVRVQMSRAGEGFEYVGWPAQLDDPGCLVGERVILRITLEDEGGRSGSDEREIVVGDGPLVPPCASR